MFRDDLTRPSKKKGEEIDKCDRYTKCAERSGEFYIRKSCSPCKFVPLRTVSNHNAINNEMNKIDYDHDFVIHRANNINNRYCRPFSASCVKC